MSASDAVDDINHGKFYPRLHGGPIRDALRQGGNPLAGSALRPRPETGQSGPRVPAENIVAHAEAICMTVPAAIIVLDSAMRILCASPAWLAWLGYGAAEVAGKDIGSFMDTVSQKRFESQVWSTLRGTETGPSGGWSFLRGNGDRVAASISISSSVDEAGQVAFTTCVAAEPAAVVAEDRSLLRLIELAPIPVMLRRLDDLIILNANPALCELTGHKREALVGCNINDAGIWESRTLRLKLEHELALYGTMKPQDVGIQTTGGERLTCALSASVVDIGGQRHAVFMFQDLTQRRRDEAELFEAIQAVMKDSTWFSRSVLERLATLRAPPKASPKTAELADLTRRENEVLRLISLGQSDLEIAKLLGLTRSTVRNHVATLYSKIDVHSRSSAIVWARERGLNLLPGRPVPRAAGAASTRSCAL